MIKKSRQFLLSVNIESIGYHNNVGYRLAISYILYAGYWTRATYKKRLLNSFQHVKFERA